MPDNTNEVRPEEGRERNWTDLGRLFLGLQEDCTGFGTTLSVVGATVCYI